jgi:plastocyanin
MRRVLVLAMVSVLVAAGCGGDDEKKTAATSTTAPSAATERVTVVMDGRASNYNGVFTAYFPAQVSVNPGTTVDFKMPYFNGEPHTVTVGTLVDTGVKKIEALGPNASFADQEATPELRNLPDVFPHEVGTGPPDFNQSAALPCFLDSGVPPLSQTGGAPACPKREQPEFNGRQSFHNSGALVGDNAQYTLKLSADIAPGTYGVFCVIHRGGMVGRLSVVDKGATVPSAGEVAAKAEMEFRALASTLEPAAKSGAVAQAGTTAALAGSMAPGVITALVAQFIPANITVAAGKSVTWQIFFFHTISFNPPDEAKQLVTPAPDGTLHPNAKAFAPSNSPLLPPAYAAFPPKATKPYLLDAGSFDGTGYKSSGIIGSIPPSIVSYKVTFTKPGSYSYVCLLHPAMGGSVKVT